MLAAHIIPWEMHKLYGELLELTIVGSAQVRYLLEEGRAHDVRARGEMRVPELFTLTAESRDGRVIAGPCSGRMIVVGRGTQAMMCIRNSYLARAHCRFDLRDDGVYVQDVQSTGGIYTEDHRRIARPYRLANGERVAVLGDLFVRVSWTE